MSKELGTLTDTGSRGVDMTVTRYWGGEAGVCIQLTAITEEGDIGYVQLNEDDLWALKFLLEVSDEQG